jgi:hypothetical protein
VLGLQLLAEREAARGSEWGLVVPLGQLHGDRLQGKAAEHLNVGALPADVVGTAVHRYLAAGLAPMGLVADASRLVTGSFYRMARAMRATRDMSVRPMVSAALMPSRGHSEERPSPA